MISCKEATNFISQQEEGKLSLRQRWQLWQHLAVCTFCKLFNKQNKVFIKSASHLHEHTEAALTHGQKESLITALKNA